jgi:hypothetical protein
VLERERFAAGLDHRAQGIVRDRQHGVAYAERRSEPRRDLRQARALGERMGAEHVRGEIPVAQGEPVGAVVAA